MNKFRIHPCVSQELAAVKLWLAGRENRLLPAKTQGLKLLAGDGCVLLAKSTLGDQARLLGVAGLELESASIKLLVADQSPVANALIAEVERLAISFGMLHLKLRAEPGQSRYLLKLGYQASAQTEGLWQRSLSRRLTVDARKAKQLNQQLGVPADYGCAHRLRLQAEPRQLASIGLDVFKREQFMTPGAAKALHAMITAAAADDIALQVVSAFRSVDYQCGLVQNKLDKGLGMDEILKVSAAPGYSEHHSGRAVDLTTPNHSALEESFADSAAFAWLCQKAAAFGFRLSYPIGNRHGVAYEPWHWYYSV